MPQFTTLHAIKREIKDTINLSLPLVTSQIVYACSGFLGTAMVAHLGEDALAASVLVSTIWMSLSVLFFGILNAISVLVAHQYGARNKAAISTIMGQAYLLGILVTLSIMATLFSMPALLRLIPQPPAVIQLAITYVHALLWMVPSLVLLIIYEQFLAGVNRTKLVLTISLIVVPIEVPLIYLLIFGKLGFPACGIAGIGYGFAITYTLTAIMMTFYLYRARVFKSFALFSLSACKQYKSPWFKELIKVGFPMGLMHVIEIGSFTVMTFWIARFGTSFLAAHQIAYQYLGFILTLAFAMSQAVTIRVGHAVGSQNTDGIRLAVAVGLGLNLICILVIACALIFFPHVFLSLDIDTTLASNQPLVHDASVLLGIMGIMLILDTARIIGFGALRGVKDTRFPMYASFLGFGVIGLGCGYLLGFYTHLGAEGLWWGMGIGIASSACMVFIRLHRLLHPA